MRLTQALALLCCTIFLPLTCGSAGPVQTPPALIALEPAVTYQTIVGWEATAQVGHEDQEMFARYKDELFNLAVNDLGINRLRVELVSGIENPTDYYTPYITGRADYASWKQNKHQVVNDNDDPLSVNAVGYQFSSLDFTVEQIVLPMQRLLAARGERLFMVINYIDSAKSQFEPITAPEEYAELVVATYTHLKKKYGFSPDAWEVNLEPDLRPWHGRQLGEAILAAGRRLAANGFTPYFIAPSTTSMANAISFFDELVQVQGAVGYLKELSYHRYSGVSADALQAIATRATRYQLRTAMLEHIGSSYEELHEDLKTGNNSAWQQYTLAYPESDNGAQYYIIDASNRNAPKVRIAERTKYLRQYFKYIRPGAVRMGAEVDSRVVDALAFVNKDGGNVVVAKATQAASLSIQGLRAGTYSIRYTTSTQYDIALPSQTIMAGQALNTAIPSAGVITIYATAGTGASRAQGRNGR